MDGITERLPFFTGTAVFVEEKTLRIPFSFVLVVLPTKPVPWVIPQGERISLPYFSWNLTTASWVKGPKKSVSAPGEPGPTSANFVKGSEFRTIWRYLTSLPFIPNLRSFWKEKVDGITEKLAFFTGTAVFVEEKTLKIPFSFVLVVLPTKPVPWVIPQGERISLPYFSWNLTTASWVKGPKKSVSAPGEPGPTSANFVKGSEFRTIWRYLTSLPFIPNLRSFWKEKVDGISRKEEGDGNGTDTDVFKRLLFSDWFDDWLDFLGVIKILSG